MALLCESSGREDAEPRGKWKGALLRVSQGALAAGNGADPFSSLRAARDQPVSRTWPIRREPDRDQDSDCRRRHAGSGNRGAQGACDESRICGFDFREGRILGLAHQDPREARGVYVSLNG